MDQHSGMTKRNDLDVFSMIIHLGMLIPGIAAWLTGELADDYEKAEHLGFTTHKWLGITLASFVCLRLRMVSYQESQIEGIVGTTLAYKSRFHTQAFTRHDCLLKGGSSRIRVAEINSKKGGLEH